MRWNQTGKKCAETDFNKVTLCATSRLHLHVFFFIFSRQVHLLPFCFFRLVIYSVNEPATWNFHMKYFSIKRAMCGGEARQVMQRLLLFLWCYGRIFPFLLPLLPHFSLFSSNLPFFPSPFLSPLFFLFFSFSFSSPLPHYCLFPSLFLSYSLSPLPPIPTPSLLSNLSFPRPPPSMSLSEAHPLN